MSGPTSSSDPGDEADPDPHAGQPIETAGAPPRAAEAAVVMLHGRGASARGILGFVDDIYRHGVTYVAPQAARSTWYPRSGSVAIGENEPWITSALGQVNRAIEMADAAGVPAERTVLFGFSQGGCLAAEYVARRPQRYGGLAVLSGSLLGPEPGAERRGSTDGTPVFLGYGTEDPYVDGERVRNTAAVFEALDGEVDCRRYDDLGHAINEDELERVVELLDRLV
ncbi:dienelactone hydrolase family protein [Salinarchaeum chitinilyticum]